MYISTDVRPRSSADALKEPTSYAYAPGGASFLSILSQVNKPAEDADATNTTNPTETDEKAVAATRENSDAVDEKPATETASEEVEAVESTSEAATSEVQPEHGENSDADVSVSATDIEVTSTPDLTGEIQEQEVLTTPRAGGQTNTPDPIATLTSVPTNDGAVTPEVLTGEIPSSTATSTARAETEDTSEEISTESIEVVIEEAPAPATTFPRNLNAVLAENAVRGKAENTSESDNALNLDRALNADVVATEPSADEPPPPPALPRTTAMESGGVRPEATTVPRVPLVNLPGELAQQIHMMQQEGVKTMRLRLVPENLGELHIEIQGTGDTMRVRLVSANAAVRDALSGQMGDLRDALHKHGLSLDQASVDSGGARQQTAPEQQRTPTPAYRESAHPPATVARSTGPQAATSPLINSNSINVLA